MYGTRIWVFVHVIIRETLVGIIGQIKKFKNKLPVPVKEIIKSLGIVFGDIGTSPIYTLTVIFVLIPVTQANVLGVLSLIIWTLISLITVQYAWLAMSLSQKGEGGTIVLREILLSLISSTRAAKIITLLSFIGISFLIGDGVITPAISILAAVEGLTLIPALAQIPQMLIIITACLICIALFVFQRWGTEKVSAAFGPLMVLWFLLLGISGAYWIAHVPLVISALLPIHAFRFVSTNGIVAFLVLSKVILCATGGEALYADMGHLGRTPIIRAWGFAFGFLTLSYLGQGAFLLSYPRTTQVFYDMMYQQAPAWYIPFLVLSVIATVIASQAMISGIFSIVYQGITTNIMPKLQVEYTSRKLRSQIYIPSVNWALLCLVLFSICIFQQSENLANAYGLAAICTMTITSMLMITIFYLQHKFLHMAAASAVAGINVVFLLSSISKIPYGAYWSIIFASLPLTLIIIYVLGKERMYKALEPMPLDEFITSYTKTATAAHLPGTAIFFSKSLTHIPSYIAHTMFLNHIIYDDTVIVSVATQDKPFGVTTTFKNTELATLRFFEIRVGYMEIVNLEKILRLAHIEPQVIFYGVEDIATKNMFWKLFALIKKLTPSFVQFYRLPAHKLHGVVMRLEM